MNTLKLQNILAILNKYYSADSDRVSSNSDEIYLDGPDPVDLTVLEIQALFDCGCGWSDSHGQWHVIL